MKAKTIDAIEVKTITLYLLISVLVAIGSYLALKPIIKLILIDTLNLNTWINLSQYEWVAFITFITLTVPMCLTMQIFIRSKRITPSFTVFNEIKPSLYEPEDYKKVKNYYESYVKKERTHAPKTFQDIPKYYPKSVYALTGGWRSGKTSAAGMLLDIMRKDESLEISSETYHDSFNFANIDESISTFFNALATKTKIPEFKNLGKVSSPGLDMGINIGPFSFKKVFSEELWANETRKIIFEKLQISGKAHIVILDDIDRLLPTDQYQWLKVVELLGRFQQKLIIIVPVHIDEVTSNLKELKLNPRYIDKIIPEQNRLSIGVNINYIKSIMVVNDRATDRIKRLYTKYLISLAVREAMTTLATGKFITQGEWYNEIARGGISEIAHMFSEMISRKNSADSSLKIGSVSISDQEEIWFRENNDNYESQKLSGILAKRFLPGNYSMSSDIKEGAYQQLRELSFVAKIFGDHNFAPGPFASYRKPLDFAPESWHDYWIEALWPIARAINSDDNLSSHFTYSKVAEEVSELMKTSSSTEERDVLINFVLRWDYL